MKTVVGRYPIQDEILDFVLSDDAVSVFFRGKECKTLREFVQSFPEVLSKKNPLAVAVLYNFFSSGMQYIVIDNVDAFKERYKKRPVKQREALPPAKYSMPLESLKAPYVEEGRLIYFVEDRNSGQPYRANIAFPFVGSIKYSRYELVQIQ